MKIEYCSSGCYNVFINKEFAKDTIFDSKDEIINFIKNFIFKHRNKLKMCGFYKIKVFVNNWVGMFLEIIKMDDLEISNSLDLRIIVYLDEDFYYETDDFFIIEEFDEIRCLNNKYYCIVNDKFTNLLEKCEFGRFIYGKEVINLLNNSFVL